MRFFTPELYTRFNSADAGTADEADAAWETSLAEYQSHLEAIREQMPSHVRRLAGLCLHDADWLGCEQVVESIGPSHPFEAVFGPFPYWSAMAVVSVKQGEKIVSLIYQIWDRFRESPAPPGWPFSEARPHWLYDEVDVAPDRRGLFLHRILLSDGRVLEIPFVSVIINTVPLSAPEPGITTNQSA